MESIAYISENPYYLEEELIRLAKFTEDIKNHLEKLEAIEKFIETTVRLQTQLDSQLAEGMKLSD